MSGFDGADYQARFDALAAAGAEVHGEAVFVESLGPATVLDAGCGTGRVAIELARRGVEVMGVDAHASMIAEARRRAPKLRWIEADLVDLDLGERFDAVVLAGNVPLFTRPGTEAALVGSCAAHVAVGGVLVAGFELAKGYLLADYDAAAENAGLTLLERWASWDRRPYAGDDAYAVSVHRRPRPR